MLELRILERFFPPLLVFLAVVYAWVILNEPRLDGLVNMWETKALFGKPWDLILEILLNPICMAASALTMGFDFRDFIESLEFLNCSAWMAASALSKCLAFFEITGSHSPFPSSTSGALPLSSFGAFLTSGSLPLSSFGSSFGGVEMILALSLFSLTRTLSDKHDVGSHKTEAGIWNQCLISKSSFLSDNHCVLSLFPFIDNQAMMIKIVVEDDLTLLVMAHHSICKHDTSLYSLTMAWNTLDGLLNLRATAVSLCYCEV